MISSMGGFSTNRSLTWCLAVIRAMSSAADTVSGLNFRCMRWLLCCMISACGSDIEARGSTRSTTSLRSCVMRFRRCSKSPSESMRPLFITITRLHIASMSSISWVVSITVTPCCWLNFLMKSRKASLDTASSPMVGSSRNRIEGECSRAAAKSHLILCPRLSCRTGMFSMGSKFMASMKLSRLWVYFSCGMRYMSRRRSKDSITGRSHHSCVRCPNTTPISRTCSMRFFHGVLPSISHFPESGTSIPEMTLTVVDFPAPFGPMYPTSSPSLIEKVTPSKAFMVRYFRCATPRTAPHIPGVRSAMRKRLTRFSAMI